MLNFVSEKTKVLLLSAHTDDCELAMGGTISRFVNAGADIMWVIFCNAWESLPASYPEGTLLTEQEAAAGKLGIGPERVTVKSIPVRHFPEHRQHILEDLVEIKKSFRPDLVFCPSLQDTHQDHKTLAEEAQRAFKSSTLLGYIIPWNMHLEKRNLFMELSPEDFEKKMEALACYKSQIEKYPILLEKTRAIGYAGGLSCLEGYSESFEVIRMVARL